MDVDSMTTFEVKTLTADDPPEPGCEMVEADEFLSLAVSRRSLTRSSEPEKGLVSLMHVSSGYCVCVETRKLARFRL